MRHYTDTNELTLSEAIISETTTTAKPDKWNNLADVLKQFWQKYKARAGIAALSLTGMEIVTCLEIVRL